MTETKTTESVNYLDALLEHKVKCILIPIALGIVGFFTSALLPKTYEAQAGVAVTNVDFGINQMNLRGLPVKGLLAFFKSGNVVEKAMSEFKLTDDPYNCTRYEFHHDVLDVETPRDTQTIEIRVKLREAGLASEVANYVALQGVKDYTQEMKKQYDDMLTLLQTETTANQAELKTTESALEKFHSEKKLETLRSQMKVQQDMLVARNSRREHIETELPGLEQLIASYEQSLAKEEKIIPLERSVARNPLLQQALAKQQGKPVEELTQLTMKESQFNPVYLRVSAELIEAVAKRESLKAELKAIKQSGDAAQKLLTTLQPELAGGERELRGLEFTRDRTKDAVAMSLDKLQDKRTVGIWPPQHLTVLAGSPPDKPYFPNRKLIALITLLAGFVLMWGLAIFLETPRPERPHESKINQG